MLVSDSVAKKVYFYKVPEMTLTDQLDNVDLRAVHGGIFSLPEFRFPSLPQGIPTLLPGGRVVLDDIENQRVLVVHLDLKGKITHTDSVAADLADEAPWTAIDPSYRYYAVPSVHFDGNLNNTVNLIDLGTLRNTRVPVTMNLNEDPHPFLVGSGPNLTLFVSLGNHIDGFKVSDVLKGNLTASSTFPNDSGLHHGNFISLATKTLGVTAETGLEVIDFSCLRSCSLTHETTVPWAVSGFSDVLRSFRPRLTFDGTHVVSTLEPLGFPTAAWANQSFDVHVTDLKTKKATRLSIGKGIAAFRGFGLSSRLAAFNVLRPEADGDLLRLLDVNPVSPRYLRFVGDVALPHLAAGPVDGVDPTGTQRRTVSITPDGTYAFVTFGGEGKIAVVNTATLKATTLTVPTALDTVRQRGGVVDAFQLGVPPVDLAGR